MTETTQFCCKPDKNHVRTILSFQKTTLLQLLHIQNMLLPIYDMIFKKKVFCDSFVSHISFPAAHAATAM